MEPITLGRRAFIGGLAVLAAPASIRTPGLIMPIRSIVSDMKGLDISWLGNDLDGCWPIYQAYSHQSIRLVGWQTWKLVLPATNAKEGMR
jgi:hypothetical protein